MGVVRSVRSVYGLFATMLDGWIRTDASVLCSTPLRCESGVGIRDSAEKFVVGSRGHRAVA